MLWFQNTDQKNLQWNITYNKLIKIKWRLAEVSSVSDVSPGINKYPTNLKRVFLAQ